MCHGRDICRVMETRPNECNIKALSRACPNKSYSLTVTFDGIQSIIKRANHTILKK